MTQAELEKRLKMIKYYEAAIDKWQQYANNYQCPDLSPQYKKDLLDLVDMTCKEMIQKYSCRKKEMLGLLDHAASESDKEVLFRRYVLQQEHYEVAEATFYSYGYIIKKTQNALARLAANLKDYPAIDF